MHPKKLSVVLIAGTLKGIFFLRSDPKRLRWNLSEPLLYGARIHITAVNPRDTKTILASGCTSGGSPMIFRSQDLGKSWKEAEQMPVFPKAGPADTVWTVQHIACLAPGPDTEPGVWYAGTSPQGLFRSDDAGLTWNPVMGLLKSKNILNQAGVHRKTSESGPELHSLEIDHRNPNHMYAGMSPGGVLETKDKGKNWDDLNQGAGAGLSEPGAEAACTHALRLHPIKSERLYQIHHDGLFRMDRAEGRWVPIGKGIPKKTGDKGWALAVHPKNSDRLWFFPSEITPPYTCPDGKPQVFGSLDGGKTWKRLDGGLPKEQAWLEVHRGGMTIDAEEPSGVYFGTSGGEIWGSVNAGRSWACLAERLPPIFSLSTVLLPS